MQAEAEPARASHAGRAAVAACLCPEMMLLNQLLSVALAIIGSATYSACSATAEPALSSSSSAAPKEDAGFQGDALCGGACSDHMVLEHTGAVLWGSGLTAGAVVTVGIDGKEADRGAADAHGQWRLVLPPKPPGTGHTVRLDADGVSRTLSDVAFGAVVLCSGQSNMAYAVSATQNAATVDIPDSVRYPDIRLTMLCTGGEVCATGRYPNVTTPQDVGNFVPWRGSNQSWARVSPSTVPAFAAVCYYAGRDTFKALASAGTPMPIGLVESALSGSVIEAWLSHSGLAACPDDGQCTESYGCPMGWCPCATVPICQCGRQYNGAIAPLLPMRLTLVLW